EALLRAGYRDVHTPFVHAKVHGANGADAVDEQQGRMPGVVDRAAHGGDIAGDAGRGFVVTYQHDLDFVAAVGRQNAFVFGRRGAFTPGAFDRVHVKAVVLAQLHPAVTEHAVACG